MLGFFKVGTLGIRLSIKLSREPNVSKREQTRSMTAKSEFALLLFNIQHFEALYRGEWEENLRWLLDNQLTV